MSAAVEPWSSGRASTDTDEPPMPDGYEQALLSGDERDDPLDLASFSPIDLGPVLAGDLTQPIPTILRRDDRQALFYPGLVNGVHGDSGVGKGWLCLLAIAQQLTAGRAAMLIDVEDVPTSIVARLRLLGVTDDAIRERFVYVRPVDPFGAIAVEMLAALAAERGVSIVVLDSLGEAFGLDGVDENSDAEVGPWLRRVARRLADAGPAVVLVDHSTKANDNPLHPSGSKRKRAAVGGASYLVTATVPLTSATGGRLKLTCAKDRHGTYPRGEHVADLVMTIDALGTRTELFAPSVRCVDDALPIVLAARDAVRAAREDGRAMSLRQLLGGMTLRASRDTKIGGIDHAVARGALSETAGPRNSRQLTYVAELPESNP